MKYKSASSFAIFCFSLSFLAGCGGSSYNAPKSSGDKVRVAFNGVESSLRSSRGSKKNRHGPNALAKEVANDDLSRIYQAMGVEKENADPDFEYDEPPLIQFQYLKALYEEVGESFAFGTKYAYTLTGQVYYDFDTRAATSAPEFLQQYTMDLSLVINIDESDLIQAEIFFDMTYQHGDTRRHQTRYADLVLDYDMDEAAPTYTLTMRDSDNLLEFPNEDERYNNAEYDYVHVEKNEIKEWRKFGVCSPEDLAHYQESEFVYKYSVLRAYKDRTKYRIENFFKKDDALKKSVIDGLGLIEAINAGKDFTKKPSTQNEKIKAVVDKFNAALGKDIVNSFIYSGTPEEWVPSIDPGQDNLFLQILPSEGWDGGDVDIDADLADYFDPSKGVAIPKTEKRGYFRIVEKAGNENIVTTFNDFTDLNVRVRSTSYDKTKWIDVEGNGHELFSKYMMRSGFAAQYYEAGDEGEMTLEFEISRKQDANIKLQDSFTLTLRNASAYQKVLGDWGVVMDYVASYAIDVNAVPEFHAAEGTVFTARVEQDGKSGYVGFYHPNGNAKAVSDYKASLLALGYVHSLGSQGDTYTKRFDAKTLHKLIVSDSRIYFAFVESEEQEKSITDAIKELIDNDNIMVPTFTGDYEYTVEDYLIHISLNDADIVSDYVASLAGFGFTTGLDMDQDTIALMYEGDTLYRIAARGKTLAIEHSPAILTLVGDFNAWNVKDDMYRFAYLSISEFGQMYVSLQDFAVNSGEAFKVVQNHSWDGGGYGFGLFTGSSTFDPKDAGFTGGENDNIVATKPQNVSIRIQFALSYDGANPGGLILNPLMIDIYSH